MSIIVFIKRHARRVVRYRSAAAPGVLPVFPREAVLPVAGNARLRPDDGRHARHRRAAETGLHQSTCVAIATIVTIVTVVVPVVTTTTVTIDAVATIVTVYTLTVPTVLIILARSRVVPRPRRFPARGSDTGEVNIIRGRRSIAIGSRPG
jgi:hypothetical protein